MSKTNTVGAPPVGVTSANALTAEGSTAAGAQWGGANSPWDFGTGFTAARSRLHHRGQRFGYDGYLRM